jgi:hypothetical protein
VDAHPRGLRRGAEGIGDGVVLEVAREAQGHRVALALGQLGERLVEAVEPALVGTAVVPAPVSTPSRSHAERSRRRRRTDISSTLRAMPYSHGAAEPPASSRKRARESQACANVSAVRS